jgi:hypothetical protein
VLREYVEETCALVYFWEAVISPCIGQLAAAFVAEIVLYLGAEVDSAEKILLHSAARRHAVSQPFPLDVTSQCTRVLLLRYRNSDGSMPGLACGFCYCQMPSSMLSF